MSEKPTYAELEKRILELEKIESECKRAEEALRENVRKYQLLESNVTDVIWILGMDLKFTYISPSVKRLQGYIGTIKRGVIRSIRRNKPVWKTENR